MLCYIYVVLCCHQCAAPSAPLCSGSSPSGVESEYPSSGGGATGGRTRTLPANRKAGDGHVSQSRGSS